MVNPTKITINRMQCQNVEVELTPTPNRVRREWKVLEYSKQNVALNVNAQPEGTVM